MMFEDCSILSAPATFRAAATTERANFPYCHIGSGCTMTESNDCVSGPPSEPMFRTIVMRLLGPPSRFMASNQASSRGCADEALANSFRECQAVSPYAISWPRMVEI